MPNNGKWNPAVGGTGGLWQHDPSPTDLHGITWAALETLNFALTWEQLEILALTWEDIT